METPKEEKKVMSESNETNREEAPRKKKNIIRVYHAQNASDGGRKRRQPGAGQGNPSRPGAPGRPARQGAPRQARPGQPVEAGARPGAAKPQGTVRTESGAAAAKTAESRPASRKAEEKQLNVSPVTAAAAAEKTAEIKTEAPKAAEKAAPAPKAEPAAKAPAAPKAEPEEKTKPAEAAVPPKQEAVKKEETKAAPAKAPQPAEAPAKEQPAAEKKAAESVQNVQAKPEKTPEPAPAKTPAAQSDRTDSRRDGRREGGDNRNQNRPQNQDGRPQYRSQKSDSRDGSRSERPDGRSDRRTDSRQDNRGERRDGNRPYGQGRDNAQGRYQRPGQDGNRPGGRRDGQDSTRGARPQDGQRRFGQGGRPGAGAPSGTDGAGRGGQNRSGAARGGAPGRRNEGGFASELAKSGKDGKRERDREGKNKKKDFEKTNAGTRRPNQGGKNQNLPKALQKPVQHQKHEEKKPEIKEIILPEKLTIRELADAMKMQPSVIVKKLFLQGVMVTVNQEIDFEKAQEIALEYDIIAEKEEKVDVIGELLKEDEESEDDMMPRPPVVCVMGHVDHGKTSLLDAIRNTNVTRGEAGGITQHIGAYVVTIDGQKITFLDTPGHEAFTAMRMRGANATDIAVLVVAADDGVMPQTVEAISHAKAAGVEIIVAINKIDKPGANIERVKQELTEYELIPEDWGGSTVFVPVSAKTGEGIESLLEMILLTAEVSELKANPKRAARGLVIEAQLDKGKGPVATILVQKGTLHVGDFIAAGACSGKVRAMMDDKGRRVKEAGPSTPVEILGLSDVPNAGEILMSFESDKEAKNFAGAFVSENKNRLLEETKGKLSLDNLFDQIHASDLKELPLIVKADVQGSVEAVKQSLLKLSNEEVIVKVIHGGVGAINESDVSLASTSNAIIIGFNVRPDALAKQLAEQENVDMRLYKVIYQAIEDVESAMKGMLDPIFEEKVIGHAEVRQLFKASGVGTIAGSYVTDGVFQRSCKVRITREDEQIYEGELASLKRFKDDVKEVKSGFECGLVFKDFNDVKEEDRVEAYIMVEVPR